MNSWLLLRDVLSELDSKTEYGRLDWINKRLLEWIAVRQQENAPLYVQEIVLSSQIASPASVHKGLSSLEREGLISLTIDPDDNRRKMVTINPRAKTLLGQLSKAIQAWARQHSRGK